MKNSAIFQSFLSRSRVFKQISTKAHKNFKFNIYFFNSLIFLNFLNSFIYLFIFSNKIFYEKRPKQAPFYLSSLFLV